MVSTSAGVQRSAFVRKEACEKAYEPAPFSRVLSRTLPLHFFVNYQYEEMDEEERDYDVGKVVEEVGTNLEEYRHVEEVLGNEGIQRAFYVGVGQECHIRASWYFLCYHEGGLPCNLFVLGLGFYLYEICVSVCVKEFRFRVGRVECLFAR